MDAIDSAGAGRAPGAGLGRSIAVVALVWTGFAALNATQVWVSMIDHHHSFPRILGYHLAVWGVWALLTPLVLRLGARLPLVPPRATAVAVHLAAALAASAVHLVTWAVLTAALEPYDVRNPVGFAESFRMGLWLRAQLELLVYASLVAVAAALEVRRRLHQREREAARFEVQLAEAKLHALELQLRPHFLFNTLHTVTGLVRAGRDREAVDTIVRLADLLHQTLETERTPRIPLAREMDLLTAYLELERTRFADRLAVSVEAEPAALAALVPPFVLQPLAENAIRHGIAATAGPARLEVTARRVDGRVEIDLFNSGPPLAPGAGGVGLANTRERLLHLYGGAAALVLEDAPGGVRARLTVPANADPTP
jgi:hypothetical protein